MDFSKKTIFFFVLICLASTSVFAAEKQNGMQISKGDAQPAKIDNEDCLACHEKINLNLYINSIHGKNRCTSCHSDIIDLPHEDHLKKVNCADCHQIEAKIYNSSDHGMARQAGVQAATCVSCHGEPHSLLNYRNPESPVYRLNIPQTCARCHENTEKMAEFSLLEKHPLKTYSETIHGVALKKGEINSAICTDCHGSHDLHSPTNPSSKIYRKNVPRTCGKCHENVLLTYERSVHGKAALEGKVEAPVCTDCHGEHTIRAHTDPLSSVYPTAIAVKTCGQCHAAEKIISKYKLAPLAVETYLESYHGLASQLGSVTVANCASCHGAHDILPASDPDSSVNKANLSKTCGKCHPGMSSQLAKGKVHVGLQMNEHPFVFYVTTFYMALIFVVIGGMILHNLFDFSRKCKEHYQRKTQSACHTRFTVNERIQHFILLASFITLAYTGFALKYPQAWWAFPFTTIEVGADWRGLIHRIAAVIFIVLSFFHLGYLAFTKRGREQVECLLPKFKDFREFGQLIAFNLGWTKNKPKLGRYSYVEKSEYWALIWGSAIMILSGTILTFANFFMRYFPKWFMDIATAIHFYEAVLATLAILVWHFYFTIFDPDAYPMNWSMLSGKSEHESEPQHSANDEEKKKV